MFKNFILTLFSLILLQNSVMASVVKFVQVTDSHYKKEEPYRGEVLKATVDTINKENDISFVVFTGDNIDRPDPESLAAFIKIINKLKYPYYLVIGNHEVYKNGGLSKKRYLEIVRDNNFLYRYKKPNYTFKKKGFVFIVADGAKEVIPGAVGYFKADTMKWLEKQLKKHHRNCVVIFQHYPLVPIKEQASHRVYNKDEYLELLDKNDNVASVIAGHIHTNGEIMRNGVYHITSPSLLNDPHSYKIITISSTRGFSPIVYTELKEVEMP